MTGCPGCSRAGTWCPPSVRSRSVWGTASAPHARSTRGCGRSLSARRSTIGHVRHAEPGTSAMPRAAARARAVRARRRLRGGRRRPVVREATFEASRCLSCGNCCECDGCLGACPEDAVIKLGPGRRYRFDYDRCTGCRACFEQCPVHSIEMFPEPRGWVRRARTVDGNEVVGVGRLPVQRALLHLPDPPSSPMAEPGRRVVEPRASTGTCPRWSRCRARPARRARCTARCRAGAGDDVHRLAGPAADDPEHVQGRGRADRRGAARGCAVAGGAGTVDLRRPLRCDGGAPDRLRPAGVGVGAGGPRPGAGRAGRDAADPRAVCQHFFDGFRTSHELNTIELLSDEDLRALVPEEFDPRAPRAGASPERPFIRGTRRTRIVYFQARETVNPFYARTPEVVQDAMDRLAERTGRRYRLVEYSGHPEAERVLVIMGSGAETARETVAFLQARGERVGVAQVRLYRPFQRRRWRRRCPRPCGASPCSTGPRSPGPRASRCSSTCSRRSASPTPTVSASR